MRVLVADRNTFGPSPANWVYHATVSIAGEPVNFAIAEFEDAEFDPSSQSNCNHVFLRIRGFSLNYRDKAIILGATPGGAASQGIGSEFIGEGLWCMNPPVDLDTR